MFIDVRDPQTKKLLFRFDPERDLVEIGERGRATLIDLTQYRQQSATERQQEESTRAAP
jgi:hypothetical protein